MIRGSLVIGKTGSSAPFLVDLQARVSELAAGEKQKVEILKELYLGTRFLILDEPTSVLTPAEADEVLGRLRAMAASGALSVLLITHKFREVMNRGPRDRTPQGARGWNARRRGSTPAQLAVMMMGEATAVEAVERSAAVLILDEPTSVLTPAEADEVLGRLRAMAASGALSVLLITHKFREVMNRGPRDRTPQGARGWNARRRGKHAGATGRDDDG